ncbi:MAG: GntR family transcriptional regulator [Lentisphaeria bacterium]|nr:GntR family transcriptional regulator [Lentisphaeria bacterium]
MRPIEKTLGKPKHQLVCDRLIDLLTTRPYKVGDKLPSERDVASELNVNVLTVRRAFRDLIAADFVTKRVGSGTYLNRPITRDWSDHAVNLVIDASCNAAVQKLFEQYGPEAAARQQREYRFVYTSSHTVREFVRSCVDYRQPTIFCGTIPTYRDFAADIAGNQELFVAAAALRREHVIPAVIGADAVGIDMLMVHLQKLGHRRIALASGAVKGGLSDPASILSIQRTAWMTRMGNDYDPALYFAVDMTSHNNDQIVAAYEEMKKDPARLDFSAVICTTDEIMYGVMAVLREKGKRIPEDVSVVSIGNTNLSRFAAPPVTGVDLNLAGHLDEAISLLFHNLAHPDRMDMLRMIKPVLVERASTSKWQHQPSLKRSRK